MTVEISILERRGVWPFVVKRGRTFRGKWNGWRDVVTGEAPETDTWAKLVRAYWYLDNYWRGNASFLARLVVDEDNWFLGYREVA